MLERKGSATYAIDFTTGLTIITPDWNTMRRYVMGGDVTMVIVCQSGEILYDVHDGWDIVSDYASISFTVDGISTKTAQGSWR